MLQLLTKVSQFQICSTPFKESSTKNNHGPTTREAPFQEKNWFLPKVVKIPVEHLFKFYKQKSSNHEVVFATHVSYSISQIGWFFPRDWGEHWKKKHLQLETSQCFTKVSPNRWNLDHHRRFPTQKFYERNLWLWTHRSPWTLSKECPESGYNPGITKNFRYLKWRVSWTL